MTDDRRQAPADKHWGTSRPAHVEQKAQLKPDGGLMVHRLFIFPLITVSEHILGKRKKHLGRKFPKDLLESVFFLSE